MTSNIFYETSLQKRIILSSNDFNSSIDEKIKSLLVSQIEEKCIREGYVKEGSIKILERSSPFLYGNQMNGKVAINVRFSVDLCCPFRGNIIKCNINKINKLGVLASNGPLSIIIARQFHTNKDVFKDLTENLEIEIKIIDKKFKINDNTISVIAKLNNGDEDVEFESESESENESENEIEGEQENTTTNIINNKNSDNDETDGSDDDKTDSDEEDLVDNSDGSDNSDENDDEDMIEEEDLVDNTDESSDDEKDDLDESDVEDK